MDLDPHNDVQENLSDHAEVIEPPRVLEYGSDGSVALRVGDVESYEQFAHFQGENDLGYQGTCGIVACEAVLRGMGVETSEAELVQSALDIGCCYVGVDPAHSGGTSAWDQAELLTDHGVAAVCDLGLSIDDLASRVEQGRGVIAEVNCGVLWNSPGDYDHGGNNHSIAVTGVARNVVTNEIQGFYINDSGRPDDQTQFVSADLMREAFEEAGGVAVYTNPRIETGEQQTHETTGSPFAMNFGYYDQYGVWWSGGHPYYNIT